MTATPTTFREAWIADLKAQPTLVAMIGNANRIKELEYQSTDWVYPAVRVSLEFRPASIYCGPEDADVEIDCFSEQKSSKEASDIASLVYELYHGKPFESAGIRFSTVVVRNVAKPEKDIFAWLVKVKIFCQGVSIANP
jgi:hypothetical protein